MCHAHACLHILTAALSRRSTWVHSLPVPMGGARAAHGEAEDVTMPAGWSLPQAPGCDPPGEGTAWRSRPSFIPPHLHESLVSSLASLLAGCQSPYLPNGNLLTGKQPGVNWGRLDQWVKQTNKEKFNGERFNILDTGWKQLCQEVTEESWTTEAVGNGCWVF